MANNKVQLSNGTVLIDLTSDTVTSASHIKSGLVGHLADGSSVTGTLVEKDVKSVTYNLTGGATASISTSEVVTGQGFSVKLKAPTGYSLSGVTVTMGGVDITESVFEYDEAGGGGGAISVVDTTDSHGGTIRTITAVDISDTTAVASDVAQGKYFYTAQGVKTAGTGSGGSGITTTEIAQQQTINVEEYFTSITASTGLVDGGAYMYTVDGTEFVGTAFPNGSMLYVNSGQTYAIGDNNGYLYLVTQSTGQHTVKVERLNL